MSYTSPAFIAIRNITRKLGINNLLGGVMLGKGYEDKFGPAILAAIREDDCVWDVGANVGLYSSQFAEKLAGKGIVVAFEPVPACFNTLEERTKNIGTIHPVNVAMGAEDGEITMELNSEELATTHRVVTTDQPSTGSESCTVVVRSAVSVVEENPEWFPNIIKVDVEGFEGAVFEGLLPLLSDHRLRCLGIEVHFGLLEQRGESDRPNVFEEILMQKGFDIQWTDPSHLVALRQF